MDYRYDDVSAPTRSLKEKKKKNAHMLHKLKCCLGSCGPWGPIKEPSVVFGVRLSALPSDVSSLD